MANSLIFPKPHLDIKLLCISIKRTVRISDLTFKLWLTYQGVEQFFEILLAIDNMYAYEVLCSKALSCCIVFL
jgi:hypothetical protein